MHRRLRALFAAAACVQAMLFVALVARAAILRPFRDMITWLAAFLRMRTGAHGSWLEYLWQPHNEHHLVLIRLLTALAVWLWHGQGVPFVIAATASMLATAWLIVREVRRMLPVPYRPLAWLGPMLMLTTPAAADCAIPINSVYPLALLFVVAGPVLFDAESERSPRTSVRRAAACCMPVMASLASGVGMVAWPALVWACWRSGARRPWTGRLARFSGIFAIFYMRDLPLIGLGHGPVGVLPTAKLFIYLLTYLGLPLSRAPGMHVPARIIGAVLLVAAVAAIVRDARRRQLPGRAERIAIAFVIAGLASGVLATIGRADLTPDVEVPLRYTVMLAPMHIGLLMLALRYLAVRVCPFRLLAGGGAATIGCLALQLMSARSLIAASDTIAATLHRYDSGIREPGMKQVVFPDFAVADRVTAALRR